MTVDRFRHPAVAVLGILLAQWWVCEPGYTAMKAAVARAPEPERSERARTRPSDPGEAGPLRAPVRGVGEPEAGDAAEAGAPTPEAESRAPRRGAESSAPRASDPDGVPTRGIPSDRGRSRIAPVDRPAPQRPGVSLAQAVGQYNRELDQTAELLGAWREARLRVKSPVGLETLFEAKDRELLAAAGLLEEKFANIRSALVQHGTPAQLAEFDGFLSHFRGEHGAVRRDVMSIAAGAAGVDRDAVAERLRLKLEGRRTQQQDRRRPTGQVGRPLPSDPIVFRKDPPSRESRVTPAYRGGREELAGDLDPTPDVQITAEIQALASSLGNSAVRIYEYVRDNTTFEPYFGSLKGSQAALETLAGNDYDLASLTIALLRASNIPSRYVRGTVKIPTQRAQDWLSVRDPDAVNRLLNSAGISAIGVDLGSNGTIDWFEVDRVWVEAQVPHANYRGVTGSGGAPVWVPLDPAFKLHRHQPGISGIPNQVPFDENGYLAARTGLLAYEWYRSQVRDWLALNMPDKSLADVPYDGVIVSEPLGLLPASLPHGELAFTAEWVEIPDILRHRFQVTLLDQFAGTVLDRAGLRTVETSLSRLTVSYTAASTLTNLAESLGGLDEVPGFLATVTPQLKIDGVVDTAGVTVNTGDPIDIRVRYFFPDDNPVETVVHPRTAGDYHALIFDSHQVGDTLLDRRARMLIDANADVGTPAEDEDALQGELLNLTGLRYWQRVAQGDRALGDIFQFRSVKQWFEILATGNTNVLFLYDRPFAVTPGNLGVDSQRQSKSQIGIDGDQTLSADVFKLEGRNGSAQEHAVWEEVVHVDSVSTIKALQFANETDLNGDSMPNNGDVLDLTLPGETSLLCPAFPTGAKNSMEAALSAGQVVKTPYCDFTMNQWSGVGWIEEDPTTGAGAYLISGFLAGGETTLAELKAAEWLPVGRAGFEEIRRCASTNGVSVLRLEQPRDVALLAVPADARRAIRAVLERGEPVLAPAEPVDCGDGPRFGYLVEGTGIALARVPTRGGAGTEDPPSDINNPDENGPPDPDDCGGAGGLPVRLFNGNMFHTFADVSIENQGPPLRFERTYNSQSTRLGPIGLGWTHTYDIFLVEDPGISATVDYGSGRSVTFTDLGGGSYDSPPGVLETLLGDASGWTLTFPEQEVWSFDLAGKLASVDDVYGDSLTLAYDGSGRLTTITNAQNHTLTLAYGPDDLIDTVSDFTGRTWTFDHDPAGNLISSSTPSDASTQSYVTTYTYHVAPFIQNKLAGIQFPEGYSIDYEYYANGKLFRHTESGRRETTYVYQPLRQMTSMIRSRGEETRYHFDSAGRTVRIEEPDGSTLDYTYDAEGNLTQLIDRGGYTWNFTWDSQGRELTNTDPLMNTRTYTYATGFLAPSTYRDRTNALTTYDVDPVTGLITRVVDPELGETSFGYDTRGRVETMTDPRIQLHSFSYDPVTGLLLRSDHPETISWVYTYDALGRRTGITDPENNTTVLEYDVLDRLVRVQDARNNEVLYSYDGRDRVTSRTEKDMQSYTFAYDDLDNLVSMTNPSGEQTRFEWDDPGCGCPTEGLMTKIEAPDGRSSTFEYDIRGRIVASTDANGRTTRVRWDSRNNPVEVVKPDGQAISYEYDEAGRLVGIVPDGEPPSTFTYDGEGRLLSAANGTTTQTWIRDGVGRVTRFEDSLTGKVLQYEYDDSGSRTKLIDGELQETTYGYDNAGRLGSILDFDLATFTISRDGLDRLTGVTYPNGQVMTRTLDPLGSVLTQVTSGPGGTAVDRAWTYDAVNRALTETDSINGDSQFAYDPVGRLVSAVRSGRPDEIYLYDANGNRIADASGLVLQFDGANQLVRRGAADVTHDERGRLVEIAAPQGVTTFGYDWNDRLTRVDLPGGSVVQFRYDPFGQRIEKDVDGTITRLLRDGAEVLARYDGAGSLLAKYVRTGETAEALKVNRSGQVSYLHRDRVQSTVAVSDAAGNVAAQIVYGAWGNVVDNANDWDDPILFAGRDFDPELGLYDLLARAYDPTTGRFLQPDPIRTAGSLVNPYVYADNDPVNFSDPSGLQNPQLCQKALRKIRNIEREIKKRQEEMKLDKQNLPGKCPGDKQKPSLSRRGHQQIINMLKADLAKWRAIAAVHCRPPNAPVPAPEPDPQPAPQPSGPDPETVAIVVGGLIVIGIILILIPDPATTGAGVLILAGV